MSRARQVIVIGGGITGLACAFRLKQFGMPVVLLEASERPGGIIATFERNGFLFEAGPQCPRFPRRLWHLVCELGLEKELVPGDSKVPRYILKNKKLHKAPFSPWAFLTTSLVGTGSKARLISEGFRHSKAPLKEETLAEFVRRKFDGIILDYLVDPFVSTLLAGDTEEIGVESAFAFLVKWEKEYGSLLRGAVRSRNKGPQSKSASEAEPKAANRQAKNLVVTDSLPFLGSFRQGLDELPKKLAESLGDSVRLRSKADLLERIEDDRSGSTWRIRLSNGGEISGSAVVIASPAYEAARILAGIAPEVGSTLSTIAYAPMAVVSSGYNDDQVRNPLQGFGFMVPRREKLNTFFCVWNSSVLKGRAPDGKVLLTSFAGGAVNPAFAGQDEKTIGKIVEAEVGSILGITGPPIEQIVWKYAKALPQFNVGHKDKIAAVRKTMAAFPGVFLAGNYLEGRSLGDCVEIAFRTAEEVKQHMGF